GDQAQQDGGQGQLPAVPEHHAQRAQEQQYIGNEKKGTIEVVLLDGVGVVGEGGEIPPGVLQGKGTDTLLGQAGESQIFVLGQSPVDKSALGPVHGQLGEKDHSG